MELNGKSLIGVVEDWKCVPKFGAHILWGNDVDEAWRTPLDYWMMSFPSQYWTSNCCANAKEEEILAVFGALYSLTQTSEGRRFSMRNYQELRLLFLYRSSYIEIDPVREYHFFKRDPRITHVPRNG